MLIYAWQKHNEKDIVRVDLEGETSLQNLFAKVLINGINHLFKRGVNRDYRSVNEDIRSVKGKIDFNTSIKKNLFINGKAQCEFDEYDEDNIQNQIIKATISKLIRTNDIETENKSKLIKQIQRLAHVSNIELRKSHFFGLRFNSNNQFYEFLINVCEMIFSNLLPGEDKGKYKFRKFTGKGVIQPNFAFFEKFRQTSMLCSVASLGVSGATWSVSLCLVRSCKM